MPHRCVRDAVQACLIEQWGEMKAIVPELPPWLDIRIANIVEHN